MCSALRWRHNDHAGVSNHQPPGCLLNRLFRRKSKKTSKLRVTGLCAGNSPGTGEFSAQMASYAENVSIWWRHHGVDLFVSTIVRAKLYSSTDVLHDLTRSIQTETLRPCWGHSYDLANQAIITVASLWVRWRLKSPTTRLFAQSFVHVQIKENIKAPRHWPLWGKFTGHRRIPRTRGQ